ncbi:L-fucose:H+ symporter permease [Pararcticibacter amylolyticus]|uniref:L-fucose:H+ symporter permease n=1 Tax=Pararcticibacter amylolyticus TaxID=2173175 RepID=A0A2U2PIN8_9SPHI|nr:L-fucose:H+ symporter permease [Pararcticibacter amylolyticus]
MNSRANFLEKRYRTVFSFVVTLFFFWGVALTLGDVLNRHFQAELNVSKSRSGLVQLAMFGAYAVMGIPAGIFLKRFGYKKGILLGLFLYASGAFLFVPAADARSFNFFLLALFILACGLATLETVAHPLAAVLGEESTSDRRINFCQAFNGLGGVIGPAIGSFFILKTSGSDQSDLLAVKNLYLVIGFVILLAGMVFFFVRVPSSLNSHTEDTRDSLPDKNNLRDKRLFSQNHFLFAVIAQFFNVAAQGGTWAYFINYGHEVMQFTDEKAGYFFSLSIAMLMAGRFVGTALMRFITPFHLLAIFALANVVMCLIVAQGAGWVSFAALLSINFFFSIMFPTIFSLGLKNLGKDVQQASSFLVMGVVGGGLFPPLMGLIANHSVTKAYYLPIICYLVVFAFGFFYPRLVERAKV